MTDERTKFEAWWPTVGQTIGKVAAWEAWQAALASQQKAHTDHPMRHWDRTCPAYQEEVTPAAAPEVKP